MDLFLRLVEELNVVALAERDDSLLVVRALGEAATHFLDLAAHHEGVHVGNLDVEQRLDGGLDFELVGAERDLENHLVRLFEAGGFLGQRDGALDDVGGLHGYCFASAPSAFLSRQRASRALMAPLESTRWSCRKRSYTFTPSGGRNSLFSRFLIERRRFWLPPSSTTSVFLPACSVTST